jgi:hypothetical protein
LISKLKIKNKVGISLLSEKKRNERKKKGKEKERKKGSQPF